MRRFHKEQKTADQATFEVLLGSELPVRAAPILPAAAHPAPSAGFGLANPVLWQQSQFKKPLMPWMSA